MEFINREREVRVIKEAIKLSKKKLYSIVVTGLRRVGKTRLILESLKNYDYLYIFVDENKGIKQLLLEVEEELKAKKIIKEYVSIKNFREFLEILADNYNGVVVFDEFQNFYKIDKSVFGELQRFFDLYEGRKNLLFIFSGSLIGLIKKTFSAKAPLYGRIKKQLILKPLSFSSILQMCKKLNIIDFEEVLKLYFVFSGYPRYYIAIEDESLKGRTFNEIIKRFFLEYDAVLEEEIEKIVTMEFGRRKRIYYAILEAIADGKNTLSEIASALNLKQTSITRQINELINFFEFVKWEQQVIGKKKIYLINHPLIEFWFRFFYKHYSIYKRREKRFFDLFWEEINKFFGMRFENFIVENLQLILNKEFTKIGRQWGKIKGKPKGQNTYEIDILAINESTKHLLACECKWQHRVNAAKVAKELVEKLSYVDWYSKERKESLAIFARSFSKRITNYEGRKVYCYDLKDLERVVKQKI